MAHRPNAIILHGMCGRPEFYDPGCDSPSNSHWLPWLQKELLMKDIHASAPELPEPFAPTYEVWREEFERYDVHEETLLVGHSCGAGFLVRWLSENKVRTKKVALVAPFIDPSRELDTGFFDFQIDGALASRTGELLVIHSTNDMDSIQKTVGVLKARLPGHQLHLVENSGHFCIGDMPDGRFPLLLELLLG